MLQSFDYLQPIFITIIIALSLVLFIISFQKTKLINGFSLISLLLLSTSISAITLWQSGIIADELNLSGDAASFYMFIAIAALALVNLAVYVIRNRD